VTIGNNAILNNNTARYGGAIYTDQGSVTIGNNATLNNNTAGYGGAIYSMSDVTIGSLAVLNNNTALEGGAIAGVGVVKLGDNATLNNNTALNSASIAASGYGGAIAGLNGVTIGNNATLNNNAAGKNGGAIDADSGDVMIGNNATLNNNTAGGNGGAVYVQAGDFTVNGDLSANNNSANNATSGMGGAIFVQNGNVTVNGNATLNNNTAIGSISGNVTTGGVGGAIYSAGTTTMGALGGNSSLSDNTALGTGGGINSAQTVTLNGNWTMNNNKAGIFGGAAYVMFGDFTLNGDLTANNNTATSGWGGVIAAISGKVLVTGNATLNNNTAGGFGGAIYSLGMTTLGAMGGNSSLSGNMAGLYGGGIYSAQGVTLNGGWTIANNTAQSGDGGALYSGGNVTVNAGGNVLFANNTAGGFGGAIYLDPQTVALNAIGGDITFSGNMQGPAGAQVANAIYIDNQIGGGGASVLLNAVGGNITFFDPIMNNATAGLITVTKTGPGMASFDGSLYGDAANRTSRVYAATTVSAGTFEVANNAVYGVHAADVGQAAPTTFATAAGTTLQGGVMGTLVADQVTIGGILNIAGRAGGTGNVFTIDSNTLTFGPGSQVIYNTLLNSGQPQNTDLLVLSRGATSGTASILVNPAAGGLGALTVGNGIRLVETQNGATTAPTTFKLGGRVAAGAYEYQLYRGGVSGDTPDDWYLRSTLSLTPSGPIPSGSGSSPGAAPVLPNYRMEVPVYMAVPALAHRMSLTMLGAYHDREDEDCSQLPTGEIQATRDGLSQTSAADGGQMTNTTMAGWGRVFGETGSVGYQKSASNFNSNGPSYDYNMGGVQAGIDILRAEHEGGHRDIAGLYLGLMTGSSNARQVYASSKAGWASMTGYSLGGYWTHKGASDWFIAWPADQSGRLGPSGFS